MKKQDAKTGLTLNEIIEKTEELREGLFDYRPTMLSMYKSKQWASNQETHVLAMKFTVGGWLLNFESLTKDQQSTVRQGFETIEVCVWAYWGGHHYDGEPVEGTVYSTLIVDRRGRWDAGDYNHLDFDGLKHKLNEILSEDQKWVKK